MIGPIIEAKKGPVEVEAKKGTVEAQGFVSVLHQHRPTKPKQGITKTQLWLIFRRMLVLVAAIVYINRSLNTGLLSLKVLFGSASSAVSFDPYLANYITSFALPEKVREGDLPTVGKGKLVNKILDGNLTPRVNQTLYLHSSVDTSFNECANWTTEATQRTYSDDFLRKIFSEAVRDTAHAIPELVGTEMVLPIVDCSFTPIQLGDKTAMRAFYLMRKTNSVQLSDSFLITFSLSIQDYRFPEQYQVGPTGVLVMSMVSDFTNSKVNHYYALSPGYPFRPSRFDVCTRKGLTRDGYLILEHVETAETYQVSRRTGIYRAAEAQQSIFNNLHWEPSQTPALALSKWEWQGVSSRLDAWGWVSGIHFFFVADTCFNLLILLIVIYRNKRMGKIWIGDAFVSMSRATIIRALLVLVSWGINGMWTAHKFMLEEGNIMGDVPLFFVYPALIHGDVMMIYLGIVSVIGVVMCERIDPALSMLLFEIGFAHRHELAMWFPSLVNTVVTVAREEYADGARYVKPKLMAISPLRMSSTHELSRVNSNFGFAALFPIFSTLIFLVAYVPLRKVYRRFYPDRVVRGSNTSGASSHHSKVSQASKLSQGENSSLLAWKSTLTIFEVATGAALQSRVGLVSDYDNCIYIKGMKFASADGIYCNGFVVVDNKYIVRTGDLWMVLLMILTRVRFHDLYVYEVDGFTVQKMARLFYPDMMKLSDLLRLHTMVLA